MLLLLLLLLSLLLLLLDVVVEATTVVAPGELSVFLLEGNVGSRGRVSSPAYLAPRQAPTHSYGAHYVVTLVYPPKALGCTLGVGCAASGGSFQGVFWGIPKAILELHWGTPLRGTIQDPTIRLTDFLNLAPLMTAAVEEVHVNSHYIWVYSK